MQNEYFRIGQGIDVHPFVPERELWLGGEKISTHDGLKGHSDADVLLHAIIDAVLGALCWGDIGQWFPDTDLSFKDAKSSSLFLKVWQKAEQEGWKLVNLDCSIVSEKPKIAPHAEKIRINVAHLFGAKLDQISVKATTAEKLGALGRKEGMLAMAIVLLRK